MGFTYRTSGDEKRRIDEVALIVRRINGELDHVQGYWVPITIVECFFAPMCCVFSSHIYVTLVSPSLLVGTQIRTQKEGSCPLLHYGT